MISRACGYRYRYRLPIAAVVAALGLGTIAPAGHADWSGEVSTGGAATAESTGEVAIDAIITGQNSGNAIGIGDIVGGPVEVNGGNLSFPADLDVAVNIGSPNANASGGDAAISGVDPAPVDITVHNRDRTDVDVRNDNTSASDSTSNSSNTNTNTNINTLAP